MKRSSRHLLNWVGRVVDPAVLNSPLLAPDVATLELAKANGMLSLLYRVLVDDGVFGELPPLLKKRMHDARNQEITLDLQIHEETRRVAEEFATAAIPVIALNGTALRSVLYEPRGWIHAPDGIDLLLARDSMEEAERLIDTCGFVRLGQNPPEFYAHHHRAEPRTLPGCPALRLELHWDLARSPHSFHLDLDGMWKRAIPLSPHEGSLLRLDDSDLLVQLCLRIDHDENYAGCIRALVEALAFARYRRVDGHTLSLRARETRAQMEVSRVLGLASLLLGLGAPAGLPLSWGPEGLRGRSWRALVQRTLWRQGEGGMLPLWYLNYATEVLLRAKSSPHALALLLKPVFSNPRLGGRGFVHPRREELED